MNADQLKAVESEIGAGLTLAANVTGAIDPALLPILVIGKAAAAALPGLVDDVNALLNGTAPDPAANAALAAKIAGLGNPETL